MWRARVQSCMSPSAQEPGLVLTEAVALYLHCGDGTSRTSAATCWPRLKRQIQTKSRRNRTSQCKVCERLRWPCVVRAWYVSVGLHHTRFSSLKTEKGSFERLVLCSCHTKFHCFELCNITCISCPGTVQMHRLAECGCLDMGQACTADRRLHWSQRELRPSHNGVRCQLFSVVAQAKMLSTLPSCGGTTLHEVGLSSVLCVSRDDLLSWQQVSVREMRCLCLSHTAGPAELVLGVPNVCSIL